MFRGKLFPQSSSGVSSQRQSHASGKHESGVVSLPPSYFTNDYSDAKMDLHELIRDIIRDFELNEDQQRAFTIVASHAGGIQREPLRMFLGGMGGTGKSTVIRALMEFFRRRGEHHRFIILAPTGTAAALLNGFTYHSVLGMGWGSSSGIVGLDGSGIRNVHDRLSRVDYIFIDEISMLNCGDMYRISANL
ncbi:hypothetical protein GGF50DRAFT_68418, partial [Schizophyllum commune]